MHPRVLAARRAQAVDTISEILGVEPESRRSIDLPTRQMLTLERIAEALRDQGQQESAPAVDVDAVLAKLEGVDGIGPKTIKAIREALAE